MKMLHKIVYLLMLYLIIVFCFEKVIRLL